jgi:hypothetical protein
MGKLPSVVLSDEQERTPLQGQPAPADGQLKRECDESRIPVALDLDVERLQVQIRRPGSACPRFLEEPPPAPLDRCLPGNALRRIAKREENRRRLTSSSPGMAPSRDCRAHAETAQPPREFPRDPPIPWPVRRSPTSAPTRMPLRLAGARRRPYMKMPAATLCSA